MKEYYISSEDFEKIKSRRIGEGADAVVYNAGKNILFKVYKNNALINDDKTFDKSVINKNIINYLDKNGSKINYKDAFNKIIDRQQHITLSSLPKAPLYIDGDFRGCVLKKINGFQLHNIFPLLSKKNKLKLLREIINEIEELTNNYIYPIDTANNPELDKHSNILVNYRLKPQLIDLDGNSTIYTETYNNIYYEYTLNSLNLLFLELLNQELIDDDLNPFNINHLKHKLMNKGISEDLADKLSKFSANYDELCEAAKLHLKLK